MASDSLRLVQFVAPYYEAARPTILRELTTAVARIAPDGGPQVTPAERERGNIRLDAPWAGEFATLDRHGNARLKFTLRVMAADPVAEVDRIVAAILTAPSRSAIEWRQDGTSRPTYYPLRGDADWTPDYSMRERQQGAGMTVQINCEIAPYSHRGSMDIFDDFSVDSLADYTFDAGAGTIAVSGGQLAPTQWVEQRFYHSARGFRYGDVQGTIKFTSGASGGAGVVGVVLKRLSSAAELLGSASDRLYIYKRESGGYVQLTSSGLLGLTANTTYWLRFRVEGNDLHLELFLSAPSPMGGAAASINIVLAGADAENYGVGVTGNAGLRLVMPTDWRADDFEVAPYTYRNRTLPQRIQLGGPIPGDVPALTDLYVTPQDGAAVPVVGLIGWTPRPVAATWGVAPWGTIEAESAVALTNMAVGADANARGGQRLATSIAAPNSASALWEVDARLLPDDERTVDVFARVNYQGAPTWLLWADPRDGTNFGARRYGDRGSGGLVPANATAASWRMLRLGRIRLGGQQRLGIDVTWQSGTAMIDYLILVPARSFASSPMGTTLDASYPRFVSSTNQTTRVMLSDGRGTIAPPSQAGTPLQEHGLGRRIELPPGNVDLVAKLSSLVIDRPNSDAASEQLAHSATVRASILPRYAFA